MSRSRRRAVDKNSVNWKTNLIALGMAQFLSLSAFSFSLPFFPLYLKTSGIVPPDEASRWSGYFISAASVSMMVMSPIWGSLGDRYGRKMMLVRANLGGAFALYLMGVVNNIEALIVLRFLQGAFTGTVSAAQTLVSTNTPGKNQGFAIGVIMAAVNAGNMTGAFLGGFSARAWGPAASFRISGLMLLASTILVLAAVRENFIRPGPVDALTHSARIRRRRAGITSFVQALPLLAVIAFVAFIQTFDGPFLSLYVDALYHRGAARATSAGAQEVYGVTGVISAVASVAAVAGSVITGIVMDRKLPGWIWALVAAAAGVGGLWMATHHSLVGLGAGRFVFAIAVSALASTLVVVLGRLTPPAKTGMVFGWSVAVRSLGWILAPIAGAEAAVAFGFSGGFWLEAGMCFLLFPCFLYLGHRHKPAYPHQEDDGPSMEDVAKTTMSTPHLQGRIA